MSKWIQWIVIRWEWLGNLLRKTTGTVISRATTSVTNWSHPMNLTITELSNSIANRAKNTNSKSPISSNTSERSFLFVQLFDLQVLIVQYLQLRMYTEYSVVVQAYNTIGSGPMSEEIVQYTGEGTPELPPADVTCTTLTSQSVRLSWSSPPLDSANGVIKGYKAVYGPSQLWFGKTT